LRIISVNVSKFKIVKNYFAEEIVFGNMIGANTVVNRFVRNDMALIANFCYNKWLISTKSQPDVCVPMMFFLITSLEVSINWIIYRCTPILEISHSFCASNRISLNNSSILYLKKNYMKLCLNHPTINNIMRFVNYVKKSFFAKYHYKII